jgi:uncharacterized protein (DUF433 family)
MTKQKLIEVDKDVVSGMPVFAGTRVPVQTFLDHLEGGYSIEMFRKGFPSVTREQAVELLQLLQQLLDKEIHANTFGRVRYGRAQAGVNRTRGRNGRRNGMAKRKERRVATIGPKPV